MQQWQDEYKKYDDDRSADNSKVLFFFMLIFLSGEFILDSSVRAAAPRDAEIFDSMLELGINETVYNYGADPNNTYHYVKPSVVAIHAVDMFGAGSIWEINEDFITVVTNRHVVKKWIESGTDDSVCNVIFFTGRVTEAELLGYDEEFDIAFLKVNTGQISDTELIRLRKVRRDEKALEALEKGDSIIVTGSVHNIVMEAYQNNFNINGNDTDVATKGYAGTVINPDIYVTDMDMKMIYANCYAETGMSGGGAFDVYGNYIGMLTGGSDENEAVCIRLTDIEAFYGTLK
ncbi:MAG: serine protease [Butyrivibrio sp.]|nr:serine protease [Butyrivibrio sp.]